MSHAKVIAIFMKNICIGLFKNIHTLRQARREGEGDGKFPPGLTFQRALLI